MTTTKTIKIKLKNGELRAYGDTDELGLMYRAAGVLEIGAVEPNLRVRFRNFRKRVRKNIKKFFRCVRFALGSENEITANRTSFTGAVNGAAEATKSLNRALF